MSTLNFSRRTFLKSAGVVGGGLVIGVSLTGCGSRPLPIESINGSFVPNAFLQITPDNEIIFYCPRDEMGQGVTTGLTTLIAEELDVEPAQITIRFAGVHSDYNNPEFGAQGTGGSTSTRVHFQQLRQAGATARELLCRAAANEFDVNRIDVTTRDGYIQAGGQNLPYGRFATAAQTVEIPDEVPLKDSGKFKYIGRNFERLDGIEKATGTAVFGIDVDLPDMHYAVVKRSPVHGGKVKSVARDKALQMPGVTDILEIGSGIAVVAKSYWQARQACQALDIEWEDAPLSGFSDKQIRDDYQQALTNGKSVVADESGDVEAGAKAAATSLKREYWAPYLAHAPMEPMTAVLRIKDGSADLWAGTQGPVGAVGLVSRFSGISTDNITMHTTYLGGGFGRRGTLTHIVELTEIVVASKKTVKLIWSREDDIRSGLYRPASLMRINASVDSQGHISAWRARRAGGNITPETLKNALPGIFPNFPASIVEKLADLSDYVFSNWSVDEPSVEGLWEDYDLPNREVSHVTIEHGMPNTFWRSVGHSFTAFAKESMIDELAVNAGIDPVELRLKNTANNPRLQNVIRIASEKMNAMTPAADRYLGFAAHGSFLTDVAQIAEVSVSAGRIRVHKVTAVVDCGLAVNPDIVRAQVEGAIMFGLTAALHGEITLQNGAVQQSNFHDYPILRMNEAPDVDVIIVESEDAPTGIGEPGLPPIAPAVANAVYRATGRRLTELPLKLT